MESIPFVKILLQPCNGQQQDQLFSLDGGVFPYQMKEVFVNHIYGYYEAHRPKFPSEPKEFYLIPYGGMKETFSRYGLQPPKFAALWLPSLGHIVEEVRDKLPEESKEIAIIAYDYHFSSFLGNMVLAVDISMGFPTFVFWEDDIFRLSENQNCYILAERIEE